MWLGSQTWRRHTSLSHQNNFAVSVRKWITICVCRCGFPSFSALSRVVLEDTNSTLDFRMQVVWKLNGDVHLFLTLMLSWVGGLLFVCYLLHVPALGFRTQSWSPPPNTCWCSSLSSTAASLARSSSGSLSVIFMWRVTYFELTCVFQGGSPSCPRATRRPGRYKILRFTSVHLHP